MALSPLRAAQELPSYPDRISALEALLAAALDRIEILEDIIAGGGTPTPGNSVFASGSWNDSGTWSDTDTWKDAA